MAHPLFLFNQKKQPQIIERTGTKHAWRKRMKALMGRQYDSPNALPHREVTISAPTGDTPRQLFAEALIQVIVQRPRLFTLVFGSGTALAAGWLLIGSVQNREWLWTTIAGSWLLGILICIGGINYLLSIEDETEI